MRRLGGQHWGRRFRVVPGDALDLKVVGEGRVLAQRAVNQLAGESALLGHVSWRGQKDTEVSAGLLDDLGQFLRYPFVWDIRLADGGEHRPHRALSDVKPLAKLDDLVREGADSAGRCGLRQFLDLRGGEADGDAVDGDRLSLDAPELYASLGHGGRFTRSPR